MRKSIPNLLVFCGSGRNIGKTAMVRSVISHNKDTFDIAAIKISPHFHPDIQSDNIIWKGKYLNIFLEKEMSSKDSSLFLQSGADPVYYVETNDDQLETAFNKVYDLIGPDKLIVCESGLLARYFKPGVLVYIQSAENTAENNKLFTNRDIADIIINIEDGKLEEKLLQINSFIIAGLGQWKLA